MGYSDLKILIKTTLESVCWDNEGSASMLR